MDSGKRDDDRISAVRATLVREQCDALVCAQPRHVLMLSGHWPVLGTAWAVVTRDARVLLVVPEDELDLATASWADAVYTFRPVSLDRLESAVMAVREPLGKALEVAGAETIGYEAAGSLEPSTYVSQFAYGAAGPATIRDLAPRARLVAADAWLARLRVRKTRSELERMRAVVAIARGAYEQGATAIRPGM